MKEIKAIFIDLNGTLYNFDFLKYQQMIDALYEAGTDLGLKWADFAKTKAQLKEKGYRGFYNTALALCQQQNISFDLVAKKMADKLDHTMLHPNPELLDVLQRLSKLKKVVILTNTTRPHLEKVFKYLFQCSIRQSGLKVVSIEETLKRGHFYVKRMSGVLTNWCKKMKVPPENTLILDDSDKIIQAAKEQGLQYRHIKDSSETLKILKRLLKTYSLK